MSIPNWWPTVEKSIGQKVRQLTIDLNTDFKNLDVKKILQKKNPYLYSVCTAGDPSLYAEMVLDAYLSSSYETKIGSLLEEIAILICKHAKGGIKSSATGLDLEYIENNERKIIEVKSGSNWGNSDQRKALINNFKKAQKTLKQNDSKMKICCIEGICYGRSKIIYTGTHYKYVGYEFWKEISGWKSTAEYVIFTISRYAKSGVKLDKKEAIGKILTILKDEGIIKYNKIVWEELLSLTNKPPKKVRNN